MAQQQRGPYVIRESLGPSLAQRPLLLGERRRSTSSSFPNPRAAA